MSGEIIFPEKSSAPASPAADLHKLYVDNSGDANLINDAGDVRKVSSTLGEIIAMYQGLPAVRAFWPCSAGGSSGHLWSTGGHEYYLTPIGAPLRGYDGLIPYVEYDGTDDAHYYADDSNFDITGTDVSTVAAQRGLTLGCWVYPHNIASSASFMTKGGPGSYYLSYWAGGVPLLWFEDSGGATRGVGGTAAQYLADDEWFLVIGRFVPSTKADIFVNGLWNTSTTSIPASLLNTADPFNIGTFLNGTYGGWFSGKISMAFICAAALSDTMIEYIWQQSRSLYGR